MLRGSTAVADPRPHVLALQHCRTISHAMARFSAVETHLGREKSSDSVSGTQRPGNPSFTRAKEQTQFCPQEKAARKRLCALPSNCALCHQTTLLWALFSFDQQHTNNAEKRPELSSARSQDGLGTAQGAGGTALSQESHAKGHNLS